MLLILAGIERFLIEFIRSTSPSPIPSLSLAQVIALALIIVGIIKVVQVRDLKAKVKRL
jgi:prolipoprotein diacylglyceryltransferase